MSKEKQEINKGVVRFPVILRAISGFLSTMTSCFITVLFSLTIYESVLKTGFGYPNAIKILIMIIGPLLSSLQFVNVNSTLAAIFNTIDEKTKIDPNENDEDKPPIALAVHVGTTMEQEMYGVSNVILRAIAGFICTGVICFASLIFTYVIHKGCIAGKPLPTELEMITVICGPILTSLAFMKAETTIKNILKIDGVGEILRKKTGSAINYFTKK